MIRLLSKIMLIGLGGFMLCSCTGVQRIPPTQFTSYEDFRPGPEGGVDLVWSRIGLRSHKRLKAKLAQYDSILLDRTIIVVKGSELDDQETQQLVAYLRKRLIEKLSLYKQIVDEPGERTLRLSIAVSNVETPNPVLAVTSSLLPVGIGISAISKITTGEHTNVGSATIELLLSDSASNTPLVAAIDRRSGNKDFSTMIDSLDDAKDAINWWIDRLGITLGGWKNPKA